MTSHEESSKQRNFGDLGRLLRETIDQDGPLILSLLIKEKSRGGTGPQRPTSVKELTSQAVQQFHSVFSDIRKQGLRKNIRARLALPSRAHRKLPQTNDAISSAVKSAIILKLRRLPDLYKGAESAVLLLLYSTSYLSGMLLGLGVPDVDIRIVKKGSPQDRITIHSAPLFSMEIVVRWMAAILAKTLQHPQLTDPEREVLRTMDRVFHNLLSGFNTGSAAQNLATKGTKLSSVLGLRGGDISLTEAEYHAAESFFSMLMGRPPS